VTQPSQKMLIIDDCSATHNLIKTRLRREPLEVVSAFDGETGVAMAKQVLPDLILLDVDMPSSDGFDVCRRLKAEQATNAIPIIFVTGASTTDQKVRGLDLGASDYITKPFDPAELRARVRSSLRTKYLMDLLSRKAMIDGLTGLWNRAYFDHRLAAELSLARRTGRPVSCIMADLDHFKSINDNYGHNIGDEVLRETARILLEAVRTEDVVCRYGGEEFAIIAPNTAAKGGAELAERLRVVLDGHMTIGRHDVVTACSLGVAEMRPDPEPTVVELADDALYRAKRGGRNRVEIAAAGATPATAA
jgi:diguanylate cyclase (GGDEF)-like protein